MNLDQIYLKCCSSFRKKKCNNPLAILSNLMIDNDIFRFLKCIKLDQVCTLVFYGRSKIKSIVYLTLDLQETNQKEVLHELINNLQKMQVLRLFCSLVFRIHLHQFINW